MGSVQDECNIDLYSDLLSGEDESLEKKSADEHRLSGNTDNIEPNVFIDVKVNGQLSNGAREDSPGMSGDGVITAFQNVLSNRQKADSQDELMDDLYSLHTEKDLEHQRTVDLLHMRINTLTQEKAELQRFSEQITHNINLLLVTARKELAQKSALILSLRKQLIANPPSQIQRTASHIKRKYPPTPTPTQHESSADKPPSAETSANHELRKHIVPLIDVKMPAGFNLPPADFRRSSCDGEQRERRTLRYREQSDHRERITPGKRNIPSDYLRSPKKRVERVRQRLRERWGDDSYESRRTQHSDNSRNSRHHYTDRKSEHGKRADIQTNQSEGQNVSRDTAEVEGESISDKSIAELRSLQKALKAELGIESPVKKLEHSPIKSDTSQTDDCEKAHRTRASSEEQSNIVNQLVLGIESLVKQSERSPIMSDTDIKTLQHDLNSTVSIASVQLVEMARVSIQDCSKQTAEQLGKSQSLCGAVKRDVNDIVCAGKCSSIEITASEEILTDPLCPINNLSSVKKLANSELTSHDCEPLEDNHDNSFCAQDLLLQEPENKLVAPADVTEKYQTEAPVCDKKSGADTTTDFNSNTESKTEDNGFIHKEKIICKVPQPGALKGYRIPKKKQSAESAVSIETTAKPEFVNKTDNGYNTKPRKFDRIRASLISPTNSATISSSHHTPPQQTSSQKTSLKSQQTSSQKMSIKPQQTSSQKMSVKPLMDFSFLLSRRREADRKLTRQTSEEPKGSTVKPRRIKRYSAEETRGKSKEDSCEHTRPRWHRRSQEQTTPVKELTNVKSESPSTESVPAKMKNSGGSFDKAKLGAALKKRRLSLDSLSEQTVDNSGKQTMLIPKIIVTKIEHDSTIVQRDTLEIDQNVDQAVKQVPTSADRIISPTLQANLTTCEAEIVTDKDSGEKAKVGADVKQCRISHGSFSDKTSNDSDIQPTSVPKTSVTEIELNAVRQGASEPDWKVDLPVKELRVSIRRCKFEIVLGKDDNVVEHSHDEEDVPMNNNIVESANFVLPESSMGSNLETDESSALVENSKLLHSKTTSECNDSSLSENVERAGTKLKIPPVAIVAEDSQDGILCVLRVASIPAAIEESHATTSDAVTRAKKHVSTDSVHEQLHQEKSVIQEVEKMLVEDSLPEVKECSKSADVADTRDGKGAEKNGIDLEPEVAAAQTDDDGKDGQPLGGSKELQKSLLGRQSKDECKDEKEVHGFDNWVVVSELSQEGQGTEKTKEARRSGKEWHQKPSDGYEKKTPSTERSRRIQLKRPELTYSGRKRSPREISSGKSLKPSRDDVREERAKSRDVDRDQCSHRQSTSFKDSGVQKRNSEREKPTRDMPENMRKRYSPIRYSHTDKSPQKRNASLRHPAAVNEKASDDVRRLQSPGSISQHSSAKEQSLAGVRRSDITNKDNSRDSREYKSNSLSPHSARRRNQIRDQTDCKDEERTSRADRLAGARRSDITNKDNSRDSREYKSNSLSPHSARRRNQIQEQTDCKDEERTSRADRLAGVRRSDITNKDNSRDSREYKSNSLSPYSTRRRNQIQNQTDCKDEERTSRADRRIEFRHHNTELEREEVTKTSTDGGRRVDKSQARASRVVVKSPDIAFSRHTIKTENDAKIRTASSTRNSSRDDSDKKIGRVSSFQSENSSQSVQHTDSKRNAVSDKSSDRHSRHYVSNTLAIRNCSRLERHERDREGEKTLNKNNSHNYERERFPLHTSVNQQSSSKDSETVKDKNPRTADKKIKRRRSYSPKLRRDIHRSSKDVSPDVKQLEQRRDPARQKASPIKVIKIESKLKDDNSNSSNKSKSAKRYEESSKQHSKVSPPVKTSDKTRKHNSDTFKQTRSTSDATKHRHGDIVLDTRHDDRKLSHENAESAKADSKIKSPLKGTSRAFCKTSPSTKKQDSEKATTKRTRLSLSSYENISVTTGSETSRKREIRQKSTSPRPKYRDCTVETENHGNTTAQERIKKSVSQREIRSETQKDSPVIRGSCTTRSDNSSKSDVTELIRKQRGTLHIRSRSTSATRFQYENSENSIKNKKLFVSSEKNSATRERHKSPVRQHPVELKSESVDKETRQMKRVNSPQSVHRRRSRSRSPNLTERKKKSTPLRREVSRNRRQPSLNRSNSREQRHKQSRRIAEKTRTREDYSRDRRDQSRPSRRDATTRRSSPSSRRRAGDTRHDKSQQSRPSTREEESSRRKRQRTTSSKSSRGRSFPDRQSTTGPVHIANSNSETEDGEVFSSDEESCSPVWKRVKHVK